MDTEVGDIPELWLDTFSIMDIAKVPRESWPRGSRMIHMCTSQGTDLHICSSKVVAPLTHVRQMKI